MAKRLGTAALIAMGCASVALAQGTGRFDGQYVGELTLTGIINGNCMTPPVGASYPVEIQGGMVRFKYVPRFDTYLTGRIDPKGNFRATRTLKSGIISMVGHIDDDHNLHAEIDSPSCHYVFQSKQ